MVLLEHAPVGRSLHLLRSTPLRGWQATAGALPSWPMTPITCLQSLRKPRPYVAGGLALATRARANKSFDTDVLAAGFARLWSAGQLRRYTA